MNNKLLQVMSLPNGKHGTLWAVLNLIRENPGISRSAIAQSLELSKPCVSEIVSILLKANIVEESLGAHATRVGRRPTQLFFRASAFHTLCLDLGGTRLRAAIVDGDGKIISRINERTEHLKLQKQLQTVLKRFVNEARKRNYNLIGIGVGVAGTVNPYSGTVSMAPFLNLRNLNLRNVLQNGCGLPVFVDNDVNLAAVGEQWRGAGRGCSNIVCISVGTGIGAGLIFNSQLYRGSHYFAGEVGYFYLGNDLPDKPYEQFGALELMASGAALEKKFDSVELCKVGSRGPELHNSKPARKILVGKTSLDGAFTLLGIVTANIVSLLDPDVVVLTGGVIHSSPRKAREIVRRAVQKIALPDNRDKVQIRIGKLADNAVLVGAAYMVQEAVLPQFILKRGEL